MLGTPRSVGVERDRGAERARERLERRLDHVVGVGAALDREVQRQLRVQRQRAEELLDELVVEVADRARRQRAPRTRTARARRCRSRTRRGPRPSGSSPGRSGRSRRGRRAPRRAPGRCRSRRPRPCGGRRSRGRRAASTPRSRRPWRASRSSMWSKKPTPVSRSPAPWPSSARLTLISVSPVLRSIRPMRGHRVPIVANACLHRPRVELEALGARQRRRRARRARAASPIRTSLKLPRKCSGDTRGGEPGGAVRRQDVVRAGDVVAERGAGAGADEHAAGAGDRGGQRLGLGADELEVLGGERLGERDQLGRASSPRTRHATAPVSAPSRQAPVERVEELGRRPTPRPRASPGRARPGPAGRARAARDRRRRRRSRAGRSGRRSRRCPTCPNTWRLASWTYRLPGPTITSTPGDRLGAVGERGDRLGAAHPVDGRRARRAGRPPAPPDRVAVRARRRAHGDPLDAGDPRGDHPHHDRARIRGPAAGHVDRGALRPGRRGR